ncbi:MAG: acyl-CoA synthetase FdrA [Nitrososphaeria archaeon]|nr:acyl-CoA synthetase FdrA [Conexivisphaerales archaeon]
MGKKFTIVLRNEYRDSVFLMRINDLVEKTEGVTRAAVMMGTEANKDLMKEAGLYTEEAREAGPNDLIIVVEAEDEKSAQRALEYAKSLVYKTEKEERKEEQNYMSIRSAVSFEPDIDLVLVSTPGEYAYREAMRALLLNKHVMVFSSNVPIEKEKSLKTYAKSKNLLVMGPDAGTAIIGSVGLGFFNVVKEGPVGVVGAAGTGIQVVTSLLDLAGSGITAAIGTGSNDVKEAIGGITLKTGINMLASHSRTKVITVISKPPSEKIVKETVEVLSKIGKPGVMNFIGYKGKDISDNLKFADTLEDAARISYSFANSDSFKLPDWTSENEVNKAEEKLTSDQVYIRGLFSGGTICYETQYLMSKEGIKTYSNAPLDKDYEIGGFEPSKKDTVLDMGAEEFVRGVPHPMIDFRFRKERLLKEVEDKEVAVILFDIVLGYGANMNPAAEMVDAIKKARKINERVAFVASVIGTEKDPQGLNSQVEQLKSAGVLVYPSSTRATQVALRIAKR